MLNRRGFLLGTVAMTGVVAINFASVSSASENSFEISYSEEEWRSRLTPAQYAVLREEATERAFTNSLMGESSPLLSENRTGTYHCAGCDLPVFSSETKFKSGTGWPSFWDEIKGNVSYKVDRSLLSVRIEEHCRRCGGHLGHVFDDGPQPTGKRHCINGLAMTFKPA